MRELDTSKYLYQLVGGPYNDALFRYAALEARNLIEGFNDDLSARRAQGRLCQRAELDNQPLVKGYLGPMYDGARYMIGGILKYDFQCTEEEKAQAKAVYRVIRYETQEAYNALSN